MSAKTIKPPTYHRRDPKDRTMTMCGLDVSRARVSETRVKAPTCDACGSASKARVNLALLGMRV